MPKRCVTSPFWGELLFNPLQNTQPPSKKAKTTEVPKAVPAKKAALGKTKTATNKTTSTKKSVATPKKAPAAAKKAATVKKPSTKKATSAKNDTKKVSLSRVTLWVRCSSPSTDRSESSRSKG